ncbi:MAG: OmpH family outer membrane protein [Acidobacteriota bacterium]
MVLGLILLFILGTPVFSQVKIGVFDSQRVSEETEEGKKYAQELERTRNAKLAEIEAKQKAIGDLQSQLSAQEISLSAEKRETMLKEIQKKNVELQRLRDDASREFQNELLEAQKKFQDELIRIVEEIGREHGFALIFEKIQCIYYSGAVDITNRVIEKFNQSYLEKQKQPQQTPPQQQPKSQGGK